MPAWDDMDAELKPILERQMEIYAGFLSHTDHHVGRLLDAIEELGVMDDTLIYLIIGDNGASAEGTLQGTFNEMINFNAMAALETPAFMAERLDKFGGPESYNHYAVGWAWAMDTPFQWTKQVASHWGGTRNGTILHWPKGIKGTGEVRSQFCHVIDVAPTVLEATGIPEPTMVNGVTQSPIEGTSMLYSFDSPEAAERHDLQYFEMFGNRGVYFHGWSAVTKHRTPWLLGKIELPAFDDDVWEPYDGKVGEGSVGATQPFIFSADEGVDVGCETGTAVASECDVKNSAFTGEINWVELKVGEDDHSHLLDPEDHINMLMGRQ
jgi:arylsulfatase A-like enzyme